MDHRIEMKINNMLIFGVVSVLIVLILFFIVFRQPDSIELGVSTFEELCIRNGDQWMEMAETRKGKTLSTDMCFGCMIADNHFCDINDYTEYVKKLPAFVR